MKERMMSEQQNEQEQQQQKTKTFTEEIEIAGNQVVEQVKELVKEGNVRLLRIKSAEGDDVFLEMPLTIGVVAGGAIALAAPWLAMLGAFAALVARVKIEIVREVSE
jgi:hypothetical protein